MDFARKIFVSYVYHDYPDSAKNLDFFIKNFNCANSEVVIGANTFEFYNKKLIPKKFLINYRKYKSDIEYHFELLRDFNPFDYSFIILLNSSCVGPICPSYAVDYWIKAITNYMAQPNAGIVAPVVEVPPDENGLAVFDRNEMADQSCKKLNVPFAHSYCLFLSPAAVDALKKACVCDARDINKDSAVTYYERIVSSTVLKAGLSLRSLMYKHRDICFENKSEWDYSKHSATNITCPEVENNYYGTNLLPYEVIFYKNIRHSSLHRGESLSGIPRFINDYIEKIFGC